MAYVSVCAPFVAPVKSNPGVWFIGPTYHASVNNASNGLLVPLTTPKNSAADGNTSAPANHASNATVSAAITSRTAAPMPTKIAAATPAPQQASNCRGRIFAHEKSSARVPHLDSRAPIPDHRKTHHIHELARIGPREIGSGVANCAINNPHATGYHHQ